MSNIPLFALPSDLEITACSHQEGILWVSLLSTQPTSHCPLCGSAATRIHSRYQRRLADLPSTGQPVRFLLSVRKFFCDVPTCPRKIFTERLAPFVAPWARVTARLFQMVQTIGLATGGRLGVRVTDRMGIQTSRLTILRRIMALPTGPVRQVLQLGIDDFSFKRGRKFGTILVNMQSHQIIDVLADRKAETSAIWMASHPEIKLVSRDRGGDYASAAAAGAPQAVQCADRFHILKNLGEALEGCLARHLAAKRQKQTQKTLEEHLPIEEAPRSIRRSPKVERLQQAYREERLACYEQVVALRKLGMSQAAIAERVGIGHSTVSNWLAAGTYPETTRGPYVSRLDPYLPYLFQRWESGCHNMVRLHQELVAQGYKGSYASVRDHLVRQLPEGKKNASKGAKLSPVPLPSRQATFLFLSRPEQLDTEEQETVCQLRQSHQEVELAYNLVQQFAQMLRTRMGEGLDAWLTRALASQIPEFRSFVQGIERDKAAVKVGLTLSTSNGLVEGKVNKLKLIKRMGYGRAAFPLLRQRVLHAL
ncbi:MAG TPA: ISL3 family transposase [Ktedonobacter sp.]|nr:ISL3 family transposase [Ktedonobacter sp.]